MLFGQPPSSKMGQVLMRKLIAHERQVKAEGRLSPALRRRLADIANGRASSNLMLGAQLVREWRGERHTVDVDESGFLWRGQSYRSLSAVAEAITGAKWSGPRFFGLLR